MQVATFLTDFADQAVVGPVVVMVAAALLLFGRLHLALAWMLALAAVCAATLALKLAFMVLHDLSAVAALTRLGLVSPSGHASAAATAYGGIIGLMLSRAASGWRSAAWRCGVAASAVAILIGATRVHLGDHTLAETILGGAVGVGGAVLLARLAYRRVDALPRVALIGTVAAAVLLLHGSHLSWENAIRSASAKAVHDWLQH